MRDPNNPNGNPSGPYDPFNAPTQPSQLPPGYWPEEGAPDQGPPTPHVWQSDAYDPLTDAPTVPPSQPAEEDSDGDISERDTKEMPAVPKQQPDDGE
jgi:hypothetical protein